MQGGSDTPRRTFCSSLYRSFLALDIGSDADATRDAARAQNYRRTFDAPTGSFRARDASGAFTGPAGPAQSEGFHEGTAWQYQ